jgi:hypothetical protein
VVAAHDLVGAREIVRDLDDLLGPIEMERDAVLADDVSARVLDAGVLVATPKAYEMLPVELRRRVNVVRLRYAADASELDALGRSLGWRRRVRPRRSESTRSAETFHEGAC